MALTIKRVPRSTQGYTEPLLTVAANAIPLHMVLIPRGTFTMGSPDSEPERMPREGPQHDVTVSEFFMGRYPITQAQWRAVAVLPKVEKTLDLDRAHFKGGDKPVEQVSWHDATEFCARLSMHTGRAYRLPSEAEWEYACRAGTNTPFYFGNTLTDELANYRASEVYADGPKGEYRQKTTAVSKHFGLANRFGLSDMHGNVFEWCADHWHQNYDGAPADGSAWIKGGNSSRRVRRGGSWFDNPQDCRSAYRDYITPGVRYDDLGFRVSCSAPSAP